MARFSRVTDNYDIAEDCTPSDTTTFKATSALYVGVAGDLYVEMVTAPGVKRKFKAAAAGYHKLAVTRVYAATLATDIVLLR